MIKNVLLSGVGYMLGGIFWCLIYYYATIEKMRKWYFDTLGIPYTSHRDKFYTFYKRVNK